MWSGDRVPVPQRWHGGADVPEHPVRPGINDRSVLRLLTEALGAQSNSGHLRTTYEEEVAVARDARPWVYPGDNPRWDDDAAEAERLLTEYPWLESLLAHHASITEQRLAVFAMSHLYDAYGFGEGDAFVDLLEFIDTAGTTLWNPERAHDEAHRERIEALRSRFIGRLIRECDPALRELFRSTYVEGVEDGCVRGRLDGFIEGRDSMSGMTRAASWSAGAAALLVGAVIGWAAKARRS